LLVSPSPSLPPSPLLPLLSPPHSPSADGQTGSGKSYSMMGSEASPGIIPRICRALFYLIRRFNHEHGINLEDASPEDRPFSVEASYLEIYNEVTFRSLSLSLSAPPLSSLSCLLFRKSAICWIPIDTIFESESIPRLVCLWRT
jgi:hypothetical protein